MADEKDFAKELNALIKRYVDGGCDPRTSLTNCYEKQIPCSGTTTLKSIWKPSLLPGVKYCSRLSAWMRVKSPPGRVVLQCPLGVCLSQKIAPRATANARSSAEVEWG